MSLLVIDNGSRYLAELVALLGKHTKIIPYNVVPEDGADKYEGIILSGGHGPSVVGQPGAYQQELDLIRNATVPIIGICLGCELIAYAFGSTLEPMTEREHRVSTITVTTRDPIFSQSTYHVYENHRWAITEVGPDLETLATSADGIEVLQHRNRPIYGFQFHPEMGSDGTAIIRNALKVLGIGSRE